ncbi:MAG: PhoH family protein [Candidatus Brocadiae bacterium]|nr:PhoH family protein [Candidatus Brocadiia bacterium]
MSILDIDTTKEVIEKVISLQEFPNVSLLFGSYNKHIKLMKDAFNVKIVARENLRVYGDRIAVERVFMVVDCIKNRILQHNKISESEIEEMIHSFIEVHDQTKSKNKEDIFPVAPRTPGQRRYMEAIRKHEIVFAIGPAGTGKTFLAVAMALDYLRQGDVKKIVLVRPAVEAGEKLGFLPGDYQEKIDPYLRPLYDSLYNLMEYNRLQRYIEKGIVEIAPLAYMRGRTLESAFIILDEAQNTTESQMKMFLTRLGVESRIVVTGDITQVDLAHDERSGLIHAQKVLEGVDGLCFFYLGKEDIVRHRLVQKIVAAYEKDSSLSHRGVD